METTFAYPWSYRASARYDPYDLMITVERNDEGDPVITKLKMIVYDPDTQSETTEDLPPELEDVALDELSRTRFFLRFADRAIRTKEAALEKP